MDVLELVIAATFTAEPVESPLAFWLNKLGWGQSIRFAPFNQVVQELLDPGSLFARNRSGVNVVLVRPEDWVQGLAPGEVEQRIRAAGGEFLRALRGSIDRLAAPLIVVVAPGRLATPGSIHGTAETELLRELNVSPGVQVIGPRELESWYPVEERFDPEAEAQGRIPFTPEMFAALATAIVRRVRALRQPAIKVIVVDADQTLWGGVAAEDGPQGVRFEPGHLELQRRLLRQAEAGRLLCLCSKNSEADVWDVFDRRSGEMPLRREHFIASRINWERKSVNLRSLALELNLGLSSFLFLDDNPAECAEARAGCPGLTAVTLPPEAAGFGPLLDHVWPLDLLRVTEEDRQRSALYRQALLRDRLQKETRSLGEFIEGLGLEVGIREIDASNLSRVAQLTERTNQFNATTRRRSESEILAFLRRERCGGFAVEARDRFGEYGIVGVVLHEGSGDALVLETFLLSCRALGKGIEHKMAAAAGRRAVEQGFAKVEIPFLPSKRNQPMRDFLESLPAESRPGESPALVFRLGGVDASGLRYDPAALRSPTPLPAPSPTTRIPEPAAPTPAPEWVNWIAHEMRSPRRILESMAASGRRPRPAVSSRLEPPASGAEAYLARLWSRVLNLEQVGVNDDFFELGGTSILGVYLVNDLQRRMGEHLHVAVLFEAPTILSLVRLLRARHPGSVGRLGEEPSTPEAGGGRGTVSSGDPVGGDQRDAPVSFAQQRLWFLDQLEPDNCVYNVCRALRLRGALDLGVLEECLSGLVRRHPALRTTFTSREGTPRQRVSPPTEIRLVPVAASAERLEGLLVVEGRRPFDLAAGPLFRCSLFRLSPSEHVLQLVMHHVISDGTSMGVLFRDLTALYNSRMAGGGGEVLALPPLTYIDFVLWQREWFDGARLKSEVDYWRHQLEGAPPLLPLPADRQRPPVQTYRGALVPLSLPSDLVAAAEQLSRGEKVTLFVTLMSAFKALLHHYTGMEDLVVGTPVANRQRPELQGVVGFFANSLALRTDLGGDPTFRELLARERSVAAGAFLHQDLPFERLVEELHPERDLGRSPVFQVMMALLNDPVPSLRLSGVEGIEEVVVGNGSAKFDLFLSLEQSEQGLRGFWEYSTDLFDRATIERLAGHFQTLLRGAISSPETRLSQLPLLTEGEKRRLIVELNQTARAYTGPQRVHDFFEAAVARAPGKPALLFPEGPEGTGVGEWSYGELNGRANRLAHHLRELGVGPEILVGVCLDRGPELVVALLAILKAGGAYVPIDPGYPSQRVAFMLEDTRAPVLLTQEAILPRLPRTGAKEVCLDSPGVRAVLAQLPSENPDPRSRRAQPANLAYLIFTSGSTGRPKGVALEHRNAAAFIHWAMEVFPAEELSGVLFSTSVCFDLSVFELFVTLAAGGRVILAENALALPGHPARGMVTLINTVPSAMAELVRMAGVPDTVRVVNLAGEPLSRDLVQRIYAGGGVAKVYDLYGPSEDTTYSTYTLRQADGPATIGRPITNSQAYILNAHRQPVPFGVPGELYLGGAGLARGYLNRPDLTAERFVPNPFRGTPGAYLYRTGDLVRYLPDGNLEYLGRMDHQVKIRGFRIELGEIETELRREPSVRDAVVIAREDIPGDKRIVAYIVQQDLVQPGPAGGAGEGASEELQREHLAQWQAVWEETYRHANEARDARFNVTGWISSFTGLPIPGDQMREWVETTVARILALKPRRVLEVGCGTGLLLFRIAPHVERFTGVDLSARVVEALRGFVASLSPPLPGVDLRQGAADRLEEWVAPGDYDLVVINSVAQYFPGADYLRRVVASAVRLVRPGGAVFLGDLRSARLLEAFHAAVQLQQAPADLPILELRQRIHQFLQREQELAVDPGFFTSLRRELPRISDIEVGLKPGDSDNELTRFRYDVVLRVASPAAVGQSARLLPALHDWTQVRWSLGEIRRRLAEDRPAALGIARVPSLRVASECRLVEWLSSGDLPATAGALREALAQEHREGFSPGELIRLGEELGYRVQVRWSTGGGAAEVDVVYCRGDEGFCGGWFAQPGEPGMLRPPGAYANNPLQGVFARRLVPTLRKVLEGRLPEYMVPSAFVLLDSIPRTPNGKVNRKGLPPPDRLRSEADRAFVPPEGETQRRLAAIWGELLGLDRVSAVESFFDLGGHSLLATQLVSRIRGGLGVELPLRILFEAPTIQALAARLEGRGPTPVPAPDGGKESGAGDLALGPVARDRQLPLSFAQQRLWFLAQYEPESYTYNIGPRFRIRGTLDVGAMESALRRVQERHESLRTAFVTLAGSPVQRISSEVTLRLTLGDLRSTPAAERAGAAEEFAAAERRRPFDLAAGSCFRATLLRVEEAEWHLLITLHHSVCDGWSMGVLIRELEASLGAVDLPPLAVQYADFSVWQREWMAGPVLQRQLAYWKDRLAGAPPLLQLPTDRPRPAQQTFKGRNVDRLLPRPLLETLRAFCHQEDATLFMVTLSVFTLLLNRYTGQEDLCVGSPIANRTRRELESLIGFFVNTLVLRVDVGGNPSFRELVRRVREVALGAYDHQDLPLEKLVEELQPERNLSYGPLFQVLFVVQNAPLAPLRIPGCEPSPLEYPGGTSKFDLTCFLEEREEGLQLTLEYNIDLFDEGTMVRMMDHFEHLLRGALARPQGRIQELPMLGREERARLVEEWNRTSAPYPEDLCAQQLFEARVARSPDATAVEMGAVRLTYHALNERANRLGHWLQSMGVGPDVRVVISVERSPSMAVAVLAVLKAGGCYVPVDPGYPPDRVRLMLEEARPKVILTQEAFRSVFRFGDATVVDVDLPLLDQPVSNPPPATRNPDRLAYVIFTSGSTGRPKGVAMPHRPLVNLIAWQVARSPVGEGDRTLQFASLSFDVHFQELFATWATGGCVVLVDEATRRDPEGLLDLIVAHRVCRLFLPYVALQHLADTAVDRPPGTVWALREVVTAGEALLVTPNLRGWFAGMGGCVLENQYGPSETHVVTALRLAGDPAAWPALPAIGRPIANARCYILGPGQQPVPVGVPGELHLGGVPLARGYLDRADLTQERFLANPFVAGERIYRTGDLARYAADGSIEFLGRADQQVKIRGFRVELGEVETVLAESPGVKEAVVVAQEQGRTKRLVAYVVAGVEPPPTSDALRDFLSARLPDYMIPSVFVPVAKLPLLPSGKVNRRALPAPEESRLESSREFVAPEQGLEESIAGVWREVLGVPRVGVEDNFFDLGGHSLLIVTLQNRLNGVLNRKIPVIDLFKHPTIRSLARALGTGGRAGVELEGIQDRARRQREAMARRKPGPRG